MKKLATTAAAIAAAAAVTITTPTAHADTVTDTARATGPTLCAIIDQHPTPYVIPAIGTALVTDYSLTFYQAGQVIGLSVQQYCPRHLPILQQFAAEHTPGQVV